MRRSSRSSDHHALFTLGLSKAFIGLILAVAVFALAAPDGIAEAEGNPFGNSSLHTTIFYAYVNAGETLSAVFNWQSNVTAGTLAFTVIGPGNVVYSPDGVVTPGQSCIQPGGGNVGAQCKWTDLTSATTGIWMIKWDTSPNSAPLGTPTDEYAWGVAVKSGPTQMLGRVYTNSLSMLQSAQQNLTLYYRTVDGYLYRIRHLGYNGISSIFRSDATGVRQNGTCISGYRNASISSPPAFSTNYSISQLGECGDPVKIFVNPPDSTLPAQAPLPDGTMEWLAPTPVNPVISNLQLVSDSASIRSGNITFDATGFTGQVTVQVDTNNDGIFNGPADRQLTAFVSGGVGSVHFDGLDGTNAPIPSTRDVSIRVTISKMGELHFAGADIEFRVGGLEVELLNGPSPNTFLRVYWNDSFDPGAAATCANSSGGNFSVNGQPSQNGVHTWGGAGTDCTGQWGNLKWVEDWSFIPTNIQAQALIKGLTADLGVTKVSAPNPYTPGSQLSYTMVVTNNGPAAVTNAPVVDNLPAPLTAFSWTCSTSGPGNSCGAGSGSGSINTTVTLNPGASATFTLAGPLPLGTAGTLSNMVCVSPPTGVTDPVSDNNCATDTNNPAATPTPTPTSTATPTPTFTPPPPPKQVPSATPTPTATSTPLPSVTPSPTATATATSTPVPAPKQQPSATPTSTPSPTSTPDPSLTPTPTPTATATSTPVPAPKQQPSATPTSTPPPTSTPNPSLTPTPTPTATATSTPVPAPKQQPSATPTVTATSVPPQPLADLAISKSSSPVPYVAGAPLTYTVLVTNKGPSNVVGAAVTDTLPAPVAAFSWTCTTGGPGNACGAPAGAGAINTTVSLTAGSSATFVISGIVPPGTTGQLVNSAAVAPPPGVTDPNPSDNTTKNENPPTPRADLGITKSSSPNPYVPGAPLTYLIIVSNAGPSSVTGAVVSDPLPPQLAGFTWTCTTAGAGNACGSSAGAGNISTTVDLVVGGSAVFRLTGTLPISTVGQITNVATVTLPPGYIDPNTIDNVAPALNPQALPSGPSSLTPTPSPTPTPTPGLVSVPVPPRFPPQVFQNPGAMGIFISPVRTPTTTLGVAPSGSAGPPAVVPVVITPPNTGDAGLLGAGSFRPPAVRTRPWRQPAHFFTARNAASHWQGALYLLHCRLPNPTRTFHSGGQEWPLSRAS